MNTVLFIGLVWPEPTSSAAGIRILQLIEAFLQQPDCNVHFASAASKTEYSHDLISLGIIEHSIALNDSSFDLLVKNISPDIVIYDRFMTEEQYSWRIRTCCPQAIHILDTEDLHFLREARRETGQLEVSLERLVSLDITQREVASILRSDLSLIISEYEMNLLTGKFNISPKLLLYLPFLETMISDRDRSKFPSFSERKGFVFIGNFVHEPNWQAVRVLKERVWPKIRQKLTKEELHIYGAYASPKVEQLNNPGERFFIRGRAEDSISTLGRYRVLLAPITFGAGIKGKLLDATKAGTPYVTTKIGNEGITSTDCENDIGDDVEAFVEKATEAFLNEKYWMHLQEENIQRFNDRFDRTEYLPKLFESIQSVQTELEKRRGENFIGLLLNTNQFQSKKYMSLWIEEKNRK